VQLDLLTEQAAGGVYVIDDHPRDVGVGDAHEGHRPGQVADGSDLDRHGYAL
jgi:hypothetical protein